MKRPVLVVILALALGVAAWVAYQRGWLFGASSSARSAKEELSSADEPQPGQSSGRSREVVALGRLEPAGKVIDVGAMMGDRVASLKVEEGGSLAAGQPLAELESRALRQLDLQLVDSQLHEAEARRTAEESLADARITTAQLALEKVQMQQEDTSVQQKKVELLRASRDQTRREAARLANLPKDLVSDQERERQALVVQQAEADLQAAEIQLGRLTRTSELALKGARADLAAAQASKEQVLSAIPVQSLRVSRDLAEAQLKRTVIVAPCDAAVLKIFTRPGELVGNAPILQVADLKRMVALAEVHETDVKDIRLGQAAVIRSRALPPPYDRRGLRGKVVRVGRMVSAPGLRAVDPFAPADRHVVEVRIALDAEGSKQSANLTNLQVDVTFLND
jgi:HlyD family secretion protein